MNWLYDYKAQFSLGILYLSSVLKEEGWNVEIFDSNVSNIEEIPFANAYGFSIVYNVYEDCVNLAKIIKRKYPNSIILAGGVHPSLAFNSINKVFDKIFIGEAEDTIRKFNASSARYYRPTKPVNLDDTYPDRSILPIDYIRTDSIFSTEMIYSQGGSTSIMFSRGCPFDCAFCCSPKLYQRKIRFRSVQLIVKEILNIIETYDIHQFRVQDDTFALNPEYLKELCKGLRKLDIFYRCSTRVNIVNNDIIKLLYESGCREIGLGIEVADDDVLKKLKKNITVNQAKTAIKTIREYPIAIRCFFMIGLPFDSYDTVQKNIDFIDDNQIDNVVVGNFIPFPGCEMYDKMESYNIRKVKKKTCMNIAKHIKFSPNILRTDITEYEHTKIMQKFYNYLVEREYI